MRAKTSVTTRVQRKTAPEPTNKAQKTKQDSLLDPRVSNKPYHQKIRLIKGLVLNNKKGY